MTKNKLSKHLLALTVSLFIGMSAHAQMKVGDNPTSINANSVLEIESTNKGLLLPRLSLASTTAITPLAAHVAGMTVYNTATAGDVTPGFYYNDGSKWVRIASPTTGLNTTAANNLITITNGTGATLTAMTVGVDTTNLKNFLNNKITVTATNPLTGNGTSASPLAITQNNTTNGQLITITNGTGASFTAMTVGVDTAALKTFLAGKVAIIANAPLSGAGTSASPLAITTGDLTAGSLLQTTGTPTASLLKTAGLQVDTTALKSFLNNKIKVSTATPLTGDGTSSNPISVTRATATSGVLTTVTNGTNAAFTALQYDVDTTALKSFISTSVGKNTTAGSLVTVTNGTGAALVNNSVAVDTTALKTFLAGKVSIVASTPLTGAGTTASPLGITQNTLSAGQLTTVTGGTNATFTAATVGIDTTALKTFVSGKTAIAVSAPIAGDGTSSNPIGVTRATATSGVLTTVTNGTNAAFTALQYDVDTTALKAFLAGKVSVVASAPITGMGTTASPLAITQNTTTAGNLVTVTNGANATFTAMTVAVDTTALKAFIAARTTNTLTNPTNTITSTVNGVAATAPAVNTNTLTLLADTLNSTVNGVVSNKVSLRSIKKLGVVTTAAATYTIPDSADVVIFNGTANATFTLPAAAASYGRELRILNYAQNDLNIQVTLSTSIISEGAATNVTDTRINSKSTVYQFPAGIGSQVFNTITLISNGTAWYKLGN